MQDFSLYYVIATAACVGLAVWLRVRLFGKLHPEIDEGQGAATSGAESSGPQQ